MKISQIVFLGSFFVFYYITASESSIKAPNVKRKKCEGVWYFNYNR